MIETRITKRVKRLGARTVLLRIRETFALKKLRRDCVFILAAIFRWIGRGLGAQNTKPNIKTLNEPPNWSVLKHTGDSCAGAAKKPKNYFYLLTMLKTMGLKREKPLGLVRRFTLNFAKRTIRPDTRYFVGTVNPANTWAVGFVLTTPRLT